MILLQGPGLRGLREPRTQFLPDANIIKRRNNLDSFFARSFEREKILVPAAHPLKIRLITFYPDYEYSGKIGNQEKADFRSDFGITIIQVSDRYSLL